MSAATQTTAASSLLFQPFRCVGAITSHVPFATQTRAQDTFVTTVVGDSYHVYNCKKLNLVFVGHVGKPIHAITCAGPLTFAACGSTVVAKRRDVSIRTYDQHSGDVLLMLPFGSHLITVDATNVVRVLDVASTDTFCTLEDFSSLKFTITALSHPSTYINKILFGSRCGRLQLWNIKTCKLLYTFKGWGSAVNVLEQAPAVDIMGIGLESGKIVIHDIKFDETLMTFTHEGGPVTSLSFRTDGEPFLASGNALGTIAIWNLEEKRLHTFMSYCHQKPVASLQYLASQPLLLSSSEDNTLKLWIFDNPDGSARVLRSREGHSAPPNKIRWYGEKGHNILSAGTDRALRDVCVIKDERSRELSQGHLVRRAKAAGRTANDMRLPAIVDFSSAVTREKDWDNVATCHRSKLDVCLWSYEKRVLGHSTVELPKKGSITAMRGASTRKRKQAKRRAQAKEAARDTPAAAQAKEDAGATVARAQHPTAQRTHVTACGNFVIVGYSDGQVHRYNMQSARHRLAYGHPYAHDDIVTGIASDAINSFVVSCSRDKTIKMWNFDQGILVATVTSKTPVTQMRLNTNNNLLAFACVDTAIRLFDTDVKKVVRLFSGHQGRITDMSWSPDGRWLLTAAMDMTVRVWDIPSGRMLSWFSVPSAVTSIDMSPQGDFLATTHVDELGIFLWVNRSMFGEVTHKILSAEAIEDGEAPMIALPLVSMTRRPAQKRSGDDQDEDEDQDDADHEADVADYAKAFEVEEGDEVATTEAFKSPEQLSTELVTLSSLPRSRWQNLHKLDVIRERNKPTEAPKAPVRAPFFLSVIPGLQPQFKPEEEVEVKSKSKSFIVSGSDLSKFQRLLLAGKESGDFADLLEMIKSLGIGAVDFEIKSLTAYDEGDQYEAFLQFLLFLLDSKNNFELCQAYSNAFFTSHGSELIQFKTLIPLLEQLKTKMDDAWLQVDGLLQYSLCMLTYFKDQR
eukprot:m.39941 g.39941  ORF g.39941 m.39941 type:complete len:966 (-) comp10369_c0_seq2:520-3417(-)